MNERRSNLVTRDPNTGLRRNSIVWPDGKEQPPYGCRWCGHSKEWHPGLFRLSVGWHTWTAPTTAQIKARMKTRRRLRLAARFARGFNERYHEDIMRCYGTPSWPTGPDDEED